MVKQAFLKLARAGAIVFLPTKDGKYLLERNSDDAPYNPGKLRPPGGGAEPWDHDRVATILREMREELNVLETMARPNLRFLGYEYREPFLGTAVFELTGHGLKPGTYIADNDRNEQVELVEAPATGKNYCGPDRDKLLTPEKAGLPAAGLLKLSMIIRDARTKGR